MFGRRKRNTTIKIIQDHCTGCGRCVVRCRHNVLSMKYEETRGYAIIIHPDQCSGCGKCKDTCLSNAIHLVDNK